MLNVSDPNVFCGGAVILRPHKFLALESQIFRFGRQLSFQFIIF